MNPLSSPTFRAYTFIRFFTALGWHMQLIVISWTVWSLTHDTLMLGMVGLAEAIPAIGAALPLGYVVDTMEKRKALIIAMTLTILSAVCTGILVQPQTVSHLGSHVAVSLMLGMIVVNGFARSINSPAMFTALSAVVPAEQLTKATAVSSATWQSAMMLGPMLGGVLYGSYGVLTAVIATLTSLSIAAIGIVRLPIMPAVPDPSKGTLIANVASGFRFILRNQVILGALSLDMLAVLFGGAVALLPAFADTILNVDAGGLGVLRAAPSMGSVLVMAWLSLHPPTQNAGSMLLVSVAAFGAITIAFALSTSFALSVALLAAIGMVDAVSVVIRHTILQLHTPDEMRGRVAAANTMFISSSNELGAVESGIAARLVGLVPSVIFGGFVTLAVVVGVAKKAPLLRKLSL